jgi:hypothetical protein
MDIYGSTSHCAVAECPRTGQWVETFPDKIVHLCLYHYILALGITRANAAAGAQPHDHHET